MVNVILIMFFSHLKLSENKCIIFFPGVGKGSLHESRSASEEKVLFLQKKYY